MSKVSIAVFLMLFWLILPVPMAFFEVGGFDELTSPELREPSDSLIGGFFQWAGTIVDGIGMYFGLLVFNIPTLNIFIRVFVNGLQLLSVLFIILFLRGGD